METAGRTTTASPETPKAVQPLELYAQMVRIREFETVAGHLLQKGELDGFLHLSIGQEAVAAGVCACLRPDDFLTTTHRGHGHCIAKGARPERMMAELFGRSGGYCGGRSGSMHIADARVGILGAHAIVAGGIPMALGGAFSAAMRDSNQVAVAFFGDGAVAQGVFHEAMNIASLWRLPIVFVCENNAFAEMTPTTVHLSQTRVAQYARSYDMSSATIDGNNVEEVADAAAAAVSRARDGGGPFLLEAVTYRRHGHFEGDAQQYRSDEDLDSWREFDPILRYARVLVAEGVAEPARLDQIHREAEEEISRAVSWARSSPASSDLLAHVYAAAEVHPGDAEGSGHD